MSEAELNIERPAQSATLRRRARFRDYMAIARPDHWTKNLFILPGLFLGKIVSGAPVNELLLPLAIGMAATCLISSANYTINEWLDRHFDRFHPKKRSRPSVQASVSARGVYVQYAVLILAGLGLSALINTRFVLSSVALLTMGFLYNVEPFRTKDRPYLDVLSESVNNPIRLCMGWFLAISWMLPPSSILLGYWFGGAFLMAVKRLAEFRTIGDHAVAGRYRKSFIHYDEKSLLASAVFYAMAASLLLGVFLIKHRIELLLSFPFIAGLFTWYLRMGLEDDSAAQHPEKLLKERGLVLYVIFLTVLMAVLFLVKIPILQQLLRGAFSEF
jgi:decaprenyl-phosphate phosphoribosyltransferase